MPDAVYRRPLPLLLKVPYRNRFDQPPAELPDNRRYGLAMFADGLRGADLDLAHQARAADDISS